MAEEIERIKISELPDIGGSLVGFETIGVKEVNGVLVSRKADLGFVQQAANNANAKATLADAAATRANTAAATSEADHLVAASDHTRAGTDHTQATSDHAQAGTDHTRAGTDHTQAASDHSTAASDHTRAGTDHNTAASDHSTAQSDHTQAGNDHTQAASDHAQALSDHAQAGAVLVQAGEAVANAQTAVTNANTAVNTANTASARANNAANNADAAREAMLTSVGAYNVNLSLRRTTPFPSVTDARNAVPESVRTIGLYIAFLGPNGWQTDQFVGATTGAWLSDSAWKSSTSEAAIVNNRNGSFSLFVAGVLCNTISFPYQYDEANSKLRINGTATYDDGKLSFVVPSERQGARFIIN